MANTSIGRPGYVLIFRPYFTTKTGQKVYASRYGKKAWPIWVRVAK